ncbi:MAG: LysR substrate-binding domain-containing protein [Acidobacteriota bacterium]
MRPLPFTLRQLQYVVAVAETGGFRRAAELCHVSQPSLSVQVAEVERSLGVQLFEREPRRIRLTPAGERVVERARRILADADELREEVREFQDPLARTLRLGVIPTIGPYLLPVLDPFLREVFEGLTLAWHEDRTSELVRAVENAELDGAIVALESDLGRLAHAEIGRDPFVLAVPPGHRLAGSSGPVAEAELAGERVLLLDDGHCFRDQALALCSKRGAVEQGFRATSLSTLVSMVAGGLGITLLPRMAVEVEDRYGTLRTRPFVEPAPSRTVVLAWRRRSALEPAFERLAEAARTSCAGLLV